MPRIIESNGFSFLAAHAPYLEEAIKDLGTITQVAKDNLTAYEGLDTLVGRGLSGALVVPFVARALGLHWAIVRKEGDGSHSCECIEGTIGKGWIFFDDLISTGKTLVQTIKRVRQACESVGYQTTFIGAYTYCPSRVWEIEQLPLPAGLDPNAPFETTPTKLDPPVGAYNQSVAEWAVACAINPMSVNGLAKLANELPSIQECMAEFDRLPKKPAAPRPTKRGGKSRRMLMELQEQQSQQRREWNAKIELALSNQLQQLLQEKMR